MSHFIIYWYQLVISCYLLVIGTYIQLLLSLKWPLPCLTSSVNGSTEYLLRKMYIRIKIGTFEAPERLERSYWFLDVNIVWNIQFRCYGFTKRIPSQFVSHFVSICDSQPVLCITFRFLQMIILSITFFLRFSSVHYCSLISRIVYLTANTLPKVKTIIQIIWPKINKTFIKAW